MPVGSTGTIAGGPQTGSGYTWYMVNWANGYSGWSVQDYLAITQSDGVTLVSKAIADGTTEQAGAAFTQSWTMRNSGTSTWTTGTYGYTLNFESGSRMGATTTYVTLANPVVPGSTVTISVPLTALPRPAATRRRGGCTPPPPAAPGRPSATP